MDRYGRYDRPGRYDVREPGFSGDRYDRYDRDGRYERDHPPPPPPPPLPARHDRYERYERPGDYNRYDGRYDDRYNDRGYRGDYTRTRSRSPEGRYDPYGYGRERDRGRAYDRSYDHHTGPPPPHPAGGPPIGRGYGSRGMDPEEERIRRETTSIFVGNLPHHFDKNALRSVFEHIGPVVSSAVPADIRTGESRR
jgi:hypothetical protein